MSRLWTPPSVSRELKEETDEFTAGLLGMVQRFQGVMDHWTREARQIDPHLECIFAPPSVSVESGLVPGRYHWMRHIPGAPPALFPIETPEGEFCEPTDWHLQRLREGDLQNARAVRDRNRAREEARAAEARERGREADERLEEIRDRYRAAFETSVSMTRAGPWTQNKNARRAK